MCKPALALKLLLCVTKRLTPDLESACPNLICQAIVTEKGD